MRLAPYIASCAVSWVTFVRPTHQQPLGLVQAFDRVTAHELIYYVALALLQRITAKQMTKNGSKASSSLLHFDAQESLISVTKDSTLYAYISEAPAS